MGARLNLATFVDRSLAIHKSQYTYEAVSYTNVTTKVNITCPIHGWFLQTPKDHMHGYGCPQCGGTAKIELSEFISRARRQHGDIYDYSCVKLVNMNTKVSIVCAIHGSFDQRPADHLDGRGCPQCGDLTKGMYTDKYFERRLCEKQTRGIVYLVTINDQFCKIGITKNTIERRFSRRGICCIKVVEMSLKQAYQIEQQLLDKYATHRYRAHKLRENNVYGWTECFPISMLSILKQELDKLTV